MHYFSFRHIFTLIFCNFSVIFGSYFSFSKEMHLIEWDKHVIKFLLVANTIRNTARSVPYAFSSCPTKLIKGVISRYASPMGTTGSVVIGILLLSTAWCYGVKQHRPRLVLVLLLRQQHEFPFGINIVQFSFLSTVELEGMC